MEILSRDRAFGFIVEKSSVAAKFFSFQMVIDDVILGDKEPCIIGGAILGLKSLPRIDLGPWIGPERSARKIVETIEAREDWFDSSMLPLAESLDRWNLRGFSNRVSAIFLARRNDIADPEPIMAEIHISEYGLLVESLSEFWLLHEEL